MKDVLFILGLAITFVSIVVANGYMSHKNEVKRMALQYEADRNLMLEKEALIKQRNEDLVFAVGQAFAGLYQWEIETMERLIPASDSKMERLEREH